MCGIQGVAALWVDQGRFVGKYGRFGGRYKSEELVTISEWLTDLGFESNCHGDGDRYFEIFVRQHALGKMIDQIRPHIHVSMKNKLCKYRFKM